MAKDQGKRKSRIKGLKNLIIILVVLAVVAGLPLLLMNYQAQRSNLSLSQVVKRKATLSVSRDTANYEPDSIPIGEKIYFLTPGQIGMPYSEPPLISNISVFDVDNDGLSDIVVCDARDNSVSWIRQHPQGVFSEKILGNKLNAPAHVQVIDFDADGDNDILVAVLGLIFPSNDKIGRVVILENDGKCNFSAHTIADGIARVSDVRAGDLDGDGDLDLAVAQFGYDDGETRWIENLGKWNFRSHILQNLSGPVNVEILDADEDGDLDIISLVSQEWEEIYCYINDGHGNFSLKLLWGSDNEDYGSSGIYICDLNQDGKKDILYTNGDAFDYIPPRGRPWHGVQWLENKGNLNFEFHRICTLVGAYSVRPVDIDGDNDLDLFVVSGFNLWDNSDAQSFIWLENLGQQSFSLHNIATNPTHLITLESGDFNHDGKMDFVTGGMHAYAPFDRMGRVTLWMNNGFPGKNKN